MSDRTAKEIPMWIVVQGDLEMVQSKESGKFYATARKCAIASTFDEAFAISMVGKQIKGTIVKETCEPYEYVVPETGEQVNCHTDTCIHLKKQK